MLVTKISSAGLMVDLATVRANYMMTTNTLLSVLVEKLKEVLIRVVSTFAEYLR